MARRFKAGDEPVPGYKLVGFLGRGGFGEVWKAAGRGVDVALKIIDLGGKTGYKEFKALKLVKLIRHPNLVPIVGFWLTDEDGAALGRVTGRHNLVGPDPAAATAPSPATAACSVRKWPKSGATSSSSPWDSAT